MSQLLRVHLGLEPGTPKCDSIVTSQSKPEHQELFPLRYRLCNYSVWNGAGFQHEPPRPDFRSLCYLPTIIWGLPNGRHHGEVRQGWQGKELGSKACNTSFQGRKRKRPQHGVARSRLTSKHERVKSCSFSVPFMGGCRGMLQTWPNAPWRTRLNSKVQALPANAR